jgi:Protein of unknown function (DUF3300)
MMSQNIDDYAAIGEAFSTNQGAVMDSIQRLRAQAYASGALRSSSEMQVVQETQGGQPLIVIQPPNPQIVYVPQYSPEVVYAGPGSVVAGLLTFGAGIAIGVTLANSYPWGWGGWGWNWRGRTMLYRRSVWRRPNIYRPPRPTYRPRPPRYTNKPGYGGNWGRPGARPNPGSRPNSGVRPNPGNRPGPGTHPNPGSGTRPPNVTRPAPPPRPAPARPPAARPAPTTRPAPATRPSHNANRNPYAGFQQTNKSGASVHQPTGGRASGFSGGTGQAARAASARGRQSAGNGPRKK